MYKVNAKGIDLNLTGEYDPPIKKTEYCSIQYFDVICIFFFIWNVSALPSISFGRLWNSIN